MLLRDALRTQSPSLALQRAAADEIARLDSAVKQLESQLKELLDATKAYLAETHADPASASQAGCPPPVGPGGTPAEGPADQGSAVGQVSAP